MNLLMDHADIFRRNQRRAMVLYGAVCFLIVGWGMVAEGWLAKKELLLQSQVRQLNKGLYKKPPKNITEDNQTMKEVKRHLTHLFSLPLPGISFSVLSLDKQGMRICGQARTAETLEKWLGHVSEVFMVDTKSSQKKSGSEWVFEVMLHEKA